MSKNKVKLKSSKGDISITIENNLKATQNTVPSTKRYKRRRRRAGGSSSTAQEILRDGAGGQTLGGGGGLPPAPRPTVDVSYIRPPPQSYSIWNDTTVPNNVGVGYAQAQQMGLINTQLAMPQPQPQPQATAKVSNPLAAYKPEMKDTGTQRYESDEESSELSAEDIAPRYTDRDPLNKLFPQINSYGSFSKESRYVTNEELIPSDPKREDYQNLDSSSFTERLPSQAPASERLPSQVPASEPAAPPPEDFEKGKEEAKQSIQSNKKLKSNPDYVEGYLEYVKSLLSPAKIDVNLDGKSKEYQNGYRYAKRKIKDLDKQGEEYKQGYLNYLNTALEKSKAKSNSLGFYNMLKEPKVSPEKKIPDDERTALLISNEFYKEGVKAAKEGTYIPPEEWPQAPPAFVEGYNSVLRSEKVKRVRARKQPDRYKP